MTSNDNAEFESLWDNAMRVATAAYRDALARNGQEGSVGWAWVTIHPGTSAFARWLRWSQKGESETRGTRVRYPLPTYGPLNVVETVAAAFAKELNDATQLGVEAHWHNLFD